MKLNFPVNQPYIKSTDARILTHKKLGKTKIHVIGLGS